MTAKERVEKAGFEGVLLLEKFSYDDALIGVTPEDRAVYSFQKMVKWLMDTQGMTEADAEEWIYNNTIRTMQYFGPNAPIIVYELEG